MRIGRSLVVLVPGCQGTRCVTGKIEVTSLSGTVVLDQPYSSHMYHNHLQAPIQPVKIANITDRQINNLLIIAVPKEIRESLQEKNEAQRHRQEMEQIEREQSSTQGKIHQKESTTQVIIIEQKNNNTTARTKNDANNSFIIDFGTTGNASIELQRNGEINTAKIGDGGSSRITIRQSR
jgi:hypothetical protein